MSTFKRFEDIQAWQLGRDRTRDVYDATRPGAFSRDHALVNQIRRACISITSNIAEGHERASPRDFARFLTVARASCTEVRMQLYVALDESSIGSDSFDRLATLCRRIGAALAALIRHLPSSPGVSEPYSGYDVLPDAPLSDDPPLPFNPSTSYP